MIGQYVFQIRAHLYKCPSALSLFINCQSFSRQSLKISNQSTKSANLRTKLLRSVLDLALFAIKHAYVCVSINQSNSNSQCSTKQISNGLYEYVCVCVCVFRLLKSSDTRKYSCHVSMHRSDDSLQIKKKLQCLCRRSQERSFFERIILSSINRQTEF